MNTFRTISRVLIVMVIMFASKTTMAMQNFKPKFGLPTNLFSKKNANLVLNETLLFGGAYKLEEVLETKVSRKKARAIASAALAARHGKVAAASAGLVSFFYSGVEEYTPERIKQLLTDILPEKCTSEEAKTAINIKLSEMIGVVISSYISGSEQNNDDDKTQESI